MMAAKVRKMLDANASPLRLFAANIAID